MKTHTELGITEEQYKNIAKLITFVREKVEPPKFDIMQFYRGGDKGNNCPAEAEYKCGTTACFCGYGPLAGIKPLEDELWQEYAGRCFSANGWKTGINLKIYNLLFAIQHKNNKLSACKRGAYFLQNGFPDVVNFTEWETPKGFRAEWKKIKLLAES